MDNMVVCPEPLAAEAGREIFALGGNAVDAAISVAFAQGVTNPLLCGIGGTGLLYCYDARTRDRVVVNCDVSVGSRPVPESWAQEYVGRSETVGRYILKSEANQIGHQSIMTPGFVRGCWVAYQHFGSGRVAWSELLTPAVRLARDGFVVYPYIAAFWRDTEEKPGYPGLPAKLRATLEAFRCYLKPDGTVYQEGDCFRQPELAATLERLAEAGGEDFYTGEIGRRIAEDLEAHGSLVTSEDLQEYPVEFEEPLCGWYRGLEVTSTPSSSSGAHLIQMLQVLAHFDLKGLGHNSPAYVDTFARVQRATFADNARLKCSDGDEVLPVEREVISRERADYWAKRIQYGDRIVVRGGDVSAGTTHVTCVDADHNVVTFTHSIGSLGGSGVVTPGLGFLHNNFLGHYNPLPGYPDSLVPGKRMGGGMPTIVFREGEPYIAIGAPGGSRLNTAVAQSLVNVFDHGMDMKTAVSVPRFHSEERQLVFLEPAFPESTAEALRALGNEVRRSSYMSRVQAIRIRPGEGELEAGPDPRGGAGVGRHP